MKYVKRFRNLKFIARRTTNIQSSVLSSSEGITASYRAFLKQKFVKYSASKFSIEMDRQSFTRKKTATCRVALLDILRTTWMHHKMPGCIKSEFQCLK